MVTGKGISLKKTIPFLFAGILLFAIYVDYSVGLEEILAIIQKVNLVYYGTAIIVLFLNMLISSLAWQYFLRSLLVKVPLRKTYLFMLIGNFVDLLVPAESISGDASKVYLMMKETGENAGKVTASVVSHRILAMIISLGSLTFSSIALYIIQYKLPTFVSNLVLLISIGTAIALFFISLCILKETLTQRIVDAILKFLAFLGRGRLNLGKMRTKAKTALGAFHGAIGCLLQNPKSFVLPIVFSLISWLLSIALSYLVFISLGEHVDFILITIVYSISVNIQAIPLGIPGEVGVVEIVMTSLYGLLGVDAGIAAAATVLIRLLTVWLRILIGLVAVQWIDLKELLKNLRKDLF